MQRSRLWKNLRKTSFRFALAFFCLSSSLFCRYRHRVTCWIPRNIFSLSSRISSLLRKPSYHVSCTHANAVQRTKPAHSLVGTVRSAASQIMDPGVNVRSGRTASCHVDMWTNEKELQPEKSIQAHASSVQGGSGWRAWKSGTATDNGVSFFPVAEPRPLLVQHMAHPERQSRRTINIIILLKCVCLNIAT